MDLVPEGLEPVDDPGDVLPPFFVSIWMTIPAGRPPMSARADQPLGRYTAMRRGGAIVYVKWRRFSPPTITFAVCCLVFG